MHRLAVNQEKGENVYKWAIFLGLVSLLSCIMIFEKRCVMLNSIRWPKSEFIWNRFELEKLSDLHETGWHWKSPKIDYT